MSILTFAKPHMPVLLTLPCSAATCLTYPCMPTLHCQCGAIVPCRARRTAMLRAPLTLLHYSDDPIIVDGGEEGWECRELSVKRWCYHELLLDEGQEGVWWWLMWCCMWLTRDGTVRWSMSESNRIEEGHSSEALARMCGRESTTRTTKRRK
jgi:hypothetical protein